jgi:hypothetical protein
MSLFGCIEGYTEANNRLKKILAPVEVNEISIIQGVYISGDKLCISVTDESLIKGFYVSFYLDGALKYGPDFTVLYYNLLPGDEIQENSGWCVKVEVVFIDSYLIMGL